MSETKNRTSRKPVPLHPALVETLLSLREASACNQPTDWILTSASAQGKVPNWPSSHLADHVLPAVMATEIGKHVSRHVFGRSCATLLKANGEDVKTVQESLRHATFQITTTA